MFTDASGPSPEPVAVVGFAGRFPEANDTVQFWRNVRDGKDGITRRSTEELRSLGVAESHLSHPDYVPAVALMPDADRFDAKLFGMTPREATVQDPQHRAFLESVHAALENAGYDPFDETLATGVFGGATASGYLQHHLWNNPAVSRMDSTALGIAGNPSYMPTLTSYRLSLTGPSVSVATACSTSLVALHMAASALREEACGIAVAGGVEIEFPFGHGYLWAPGSIFARDGVCRPFDAAASGTVFGSGVGVVVLKLLRDALEDGDAVRAVIRGSAVNNDGSDKVSFSAPSVSGQVAVIRAAMEQAGTEPGDIGYVEAHGTATQLGDPLEISALTQAYGEMGGPQLSPGSIPIGSVKSNVGHLGPAAGVTGLIKTILAMENEQIPANLHYESPNPEIEFDKTPFTVNTDLRPWPRTPDRPRVAAVSSFGIGGTNAHVIVEEAPEREAVEPSGRPQLLVWSARDENALDTSRRELADYFEERDDDGVDDPSHTLQVGRTHHPVRAAAVCATATEAARALANNGRDVLRGAGSGTPRDICFMFPGQGSQRVRMARGLYRELPRFAEVMDECLDLFAEEDIDLRDAWWSGEPDSLDHTSLAQPVLFAVEYAMACALAEAGVRPDVVLGHSLGELVAATVAGVFELADAVRVVAARGRYMGQMPSGTMLAVAIPHTDLEDFEHDGVTLAAVNGPTQITVSGSAESIAGFQEVLRDAGVYCRPLRTSHAFHGPSMAGAVEAFEAVVRQSVLHAPSVRVVSAATGREITAEEAVSPEFWARQLVEPVHFHAAVEHVLADSPHLVMEVGPSQTLTGLVRQNVPVVRGESAVVSVSPRGPGEEADVRAYLTALGTVHVEGHELRWPLWPGGRRVPMPGYAYQRERYWMDPPEQTPDPAPSREPVPSAVEAEEAREVVATEEESPEVSPFATLRWTETATSTTAAKPVAPKRVLALLPESPREARPVLGALHRAGHQVFRVRAGSLPHLGDEEFTVRPGHAEDLAEVLAELRRRNKAPHVLVHAWAVAALEPANSKNCEDQVSEEVLSFFDLAKLGAQRPVDHVLPEIVVVSSGAVDVSGAEDTHPVKSMLLGATATLSEEAPGVRCRLVDIDARVDERMLAAELERETSAPVVAWRGFRRWERSERELVASPGRGLVLRDEGHYVVTGGLGGLGLETAKGLVKAGVRPRLVLLGRRVPGGEDSLPEPAARRVRTAIAEMEALGAVVRPLACDVSDEGQVQRALDAAIAEFGPVSGIVHCAGVPGDGLIQLRERSEAMAVIRPKVRGTLLLQEYMEKQPRPDFFAAFSSRSGTHGLVGSGDYSAANAFLDAYAASRHTDGRTLSIGWPSWQQVGMAAQETGGPAASSAEETTDGALLDEVFDASTHWVLDEHRIGRLPVMPGTGQLDLVLRAWRHKAGERGAPRLEDVTFLRPIVVETPRRIQVVASPGQDEERFTVRSRPAEGGDWTEHTTGVVRIVARVDRRTDPEALEDHLASQTPPVSEASGDSGLVTFGPRWDNLGREVRGEHADLVELVLPREFSDDLDEHVLHPALLDGATASAQRPVSFSRLPFMYQAITVFDTLPERFWAHLTYRSADHRAVVVDIELIAPDGRVLVSIDGFTMRPVERNSFSGGLGAADTGSRAAKGPALPGAADEHSGLDPHIGVGLFLRLLEAPVPAHVLVRPYADDRPEPLAPEPVEEHHVATRPVTPEPARPVPRETEGRSEQVSVPASAPVAVAEAPHEDGGDDAVLSTIRGLWAEALGIPNIGNDDDFFELGGNSLTAVELTAQLRESFGVVLSVAQLFEYPTAELLAGVVREQRDA